jgi:putative ABC transport system permease protein
MNLFASVAILLACLGLFGLSTLVVQQRIKEVSIRKVLGASMVQIITILSGGFTRLVLLAFFISAPVAWYGMHLWLQDFAYAIKLEAWVFGAVGLLAIVVAFVTVSIQGLQAAMTNPAETLKSE